MSHAHVSLSAVRFSESTSNEVTVIDDQQTIHDLLDGLNDDDCRAILDVTSGNSLSANEIAESCDLPLSTTYRKLELLTDTGLLDERTRIQESGKHVHEYSRLADDVVVLLSICGDIELRVTGRENLGLVDAAVTTKI